MKQRLCKMLSILLSIALFASACVGALSASVLTAKADLPEEEGYLDDLFSEMRSVCPSGSLTQFDSIHQQLTDNFNSWLIMIEHKLGSDDWAVSSYAPASELLFWHTFYGGDYIFRPRYVNDWYNYNFYSRYGFMIKNGQFYNEPYNTGLGNTNFTSGVLSSSDIWKWWYCTPSDVDDQRYECWSNQDLRMLRQNGDWSNNGDFIVYITANLFNGTYTPPVIDFHWFKFQLGQRWYVTTYDQTLISNLETGDDTYWVWFIQEFPYDYLETEEYHRLYIYWRDIQVLSGAENFISQSLSNVSSSGVLAFDITDLILSGEFEFLGQSKFYQILDGPSGPSIGNLMAQSNDYIDLDLTPDEINESQNNAWDQISDYTQNYPSVTISPQELAEQVLGSRAYTGSMGIIQIPSGIYDWCVQNKPNDIQHGDISADGYWHYKLDSSGILSTNLSMINWELCNACIIPAPDPSWVMNYIGIDSYSFPVYWWNPSDQVISDASYLGLFTIDMILQQFDIVIFAPSDAPYLSNFDGIFQFTGSIGFTNLELDSQIGAVNGATRHQVFICSTDKVLLKSQLYAFCDSSSKMYDLLSQYIEKRDIWDESFFKWSMSVFWELETVNGHLNAIRNEVIGWHLSDKFNDLISKADQIIQNTAPVDEENVDPWYLSLWNFILQFKPSNSQISTGIDYIDQNLDDIPLLPYLTPVPALPTPGGG